MGWFDEVKKAAGTAVDVVKAPVKTAVDVVTGKSVKDSLEDQWEGIDERHGISEGWENLTGGGGGGGGGGSSKPNYYIVKPGDFYVDPSAMQSTGMGIAGNAALLPSDLYQQAAGKWFDFGLDPTGGLADKYMYDPNLIKTDELEQMQAFDYDPLRQQAMADIRGQSSAALQGALTQQAAAGGLTAADRMALASSFNRQRMGGTADVLGKYGIAEAQNIWETEQANKELLNKAYLQNLETMNQADLRNIDTLMAQQEKADQKAIDLYEADMQRRIARELGGQTLVSQAEIDAKKEEKQKSKPKPKPKKQGSVGKVKSGSNVGKPYMYEEQPDVY